MAPTVPQLPSLAALRCRDDRAGTLGSLREWARCHLQQGDLGIVAQQLSPEERHAVMHFLWEESKRGPRSGWARTLAAQLRGCPEFEVPSEDQPWSPEAAEAAARAPSVSPEAEPPVASGLPRASELTDPQAIGGELFQSLRAWVRARRHEGSLDVEGAKLGANYRSCLFAFLMDFVTRHTIFRSQAQDMLKKLLDIPEWRQGAVDAAAARALLRGLEAQGEDVKPSGCSTPPPAAELPPPPTQKDLAGRADHQELLLQLCLWINAAQRSGTLAAEAAALDDEHRQAITAFLLAEAPAVPQRRGGSRLLSSLRQASAKAMPKTFVTRTEIREDHGAECWADRKYVLQALAELGDWFDCGGMVDQTTVSRALARADI